MAEEISSDINGNQRNHSWVLDLDEKLKTMASTQEKELLKDGKLAESSIYKVPATVHERQRDPDVYGPINVSFGPYYHGHKSCEKTQDIKEGVVLSSLRRSGKTAAQYAEALRPWVQFLKDRYDKLDPRWQEDNEGFLQLMIYDGCFILEILHDASKISEANYSGNNYLSDNPACKIDFRPPVSPHELMEHYRHDLLLLENQLPMSVLYFLLSVQTGKTLEEYVQKIEAERYLYEHLLRFIFPTATKISVPLGCKHIPEFCRGALLENEHEDINSHGNVFAVIALRTLLSPILLVYMICCYLFKFPRYLFKFLRNLYKTQSPTEFHFNIPSAADIKKVGIGLSRSKYRSLTDISVERRTLRLPDIYVDGATKSLFLNIIAFEQLHHRVPKTVTSYVYFMTSLLQGADDVKLLKLHGIIRTELGNDEVAEIFNSMGKGIFRDPETFLVRKNIKMGRKLRELFDKMSEEWRVDLWQKYLRSPWAIISLIGAFLLFCLTAIQTIYTVLGYHSPK